MTKHDIKSPSLSKVYSVLPILLLVLFVLLAFTSMQKKSVTVDEYAHLPSGYWSLTEDDFSLFPNNPPLIKELAAVPLVLRGIDFKKSDHPEATNRLMMAVSFMKANRADYASIFASARMAIILIGLIGGIVVYFWARELYGPGGGSLALFFYALSPNLLAHTRLVTTDLGCAVFMLVALFFFSRFLDNRSWIRVVIFGVVLGLAELTKFSALTLYPVLVIFFIIVSLKSGDIRARAPGFAAALIISVVVINAGYYFSGSFTMLGSYSFNSNLMSAVQGALPAYLPLPLPYDYVLGFDVLKADTDRAFTQFFMGVFSFDRGWFWYYPVAFLFKVPLGILVALALLPLLRAVGRLPKLKTDEALLLFFAAFYLFLVTVGAGINIGFRYVIPLLPLLHILAARLVLSDRTCAYRKWIIGFIIVIYAGASFSIYPHYLSYFNIFAGGPTGGERYLLDSNIDWGQDLPYLKDYMEDNDIDTIDLAYFGNVDPEVYGVRYRPLTSSKEHGKVAVSVNCYYGMQCIMLDLKSMSTANRGLGYYDYLKQYRIVDRVGGSILILDLDKESSF